MTATAAGSTAATKTFMRAEIEEIPAAVARLLAQHEAIEKAGAALRQRDPGLVVTIARGSSDHASAFLKYAIELTAGIPVASIGPSIMSIYGRPLRLKGAAAIATSQSGKSPDIVAMAEAARTSGALTIAVTNTLDSPLAHGADQAIGLAAGEEKSVAATKTFVNSVVAGLAVLAAWQQDETFKRALAALPEGLEKAIACDWSQLADGLGDHRSLYVLGRGPTLAIAGEAALKFKETCGLHAEAYSSAEVLHGPARIVENGFPVLALAVADAAETSVAESIDRLVGQGATGFATTDRAKAALRLPSATTGHPLCDALALVASFYAFVEAQSRRLGYDPDRPPHLMKVTRTT
jgi:glucosamine--fructose-6-phosphate aminotransferase (isomerizing)